MMLWSIKGSSVNLASEKCIVLRRHRRFLVCQPWLSFGCATFSSAYIRRLPLLLFCALDTGHFQKTNLLCHSPQRTVYRFPSSHTGGCPALTWARAALPIACSELPHRGASPAPRR